MSSMAWIHWQQCLPGRRRLKRNRHSACSFAKSELLNHKAGNMRTATFSILLTLSVVTNALPEDGNSSRVAVVIAPDADKLERFAAAELCGFLDAEWPNVSRWAHGQAARAWRSQSPRILRRAIPSPARRTRSSPCLEGDGTVWPGLHDWAYRKTAASDV